MENLIDGLQLYMDDPLRLHKSLVSTEFVKGEKMTEQESLVRMILQCEDLQTWFVIDDSVFRCLFGCVFEFVYLFVCIGRICIYLKYLPRCIFIFLAPAV